MTVVMKRFCAHAGCNALVVNGFCPNHIQQGTKTHRQAEEDAKFYGSGRWKRLRAQHRGEEPLCRECAKEGKVVAGQMVDHIEPIRQGSDPFDDSNLQTLCDMHHSRKRRQEGIRGVSQTQPVFRPSAIPLTIVCGPPGSGKTTYVLSQAKPEDLRIDLDEIGCKLMGLQLDTTYANHGWDKSFLTCAIRRRDELLNSLSRVSGKAAFFIVGEPTAEGRQRWSDTLKPQRVIVLETPIDVCLQRIAKDGENVKARSDAAVEWWQAYTRREEDERDRMGVSVIEIKAGGKSFVFNTC